LVKYLDKEKKEEKELMQWENFVRNIKRIEKLELE
jgi:hypothetical protein